ncbi:hypothetical protein COY59_02015 [Candidatus Gottesmanbacteria bacterium CG_4_10_14_0_8_um_filter_37_24]|uniref:Glycosyltransferase RgtA/B/C/D-like domain-containing protein n=1 Tax=Candidatus Gottesmanbacteria bacterium CG_4_10_14_0_8_um_filter_37_24 TaxID=1974574 RepID=A0A2M7RRQ9_9BACT|nr:MAG: hypothetical protein COX23_02095 [Candidatus Gottesmanbacteria bacterium CG23_combo_of_CG06-09_8_20_14_all_37_19]PIZ02962.1 MAG: hypothetical protein COY59_02015 [Candidatus Gottesmanbacteria bacterium CG_4_10_14_0_8_um_filter_37_24]
MNINSERLYAKISMMKKTGIILILIVILGVILRFFQLGRVPISLEWDEVALGYDAFSILQTGKDQFGKAFPLTFRSLDDYKPPIYEYLTVPSILFFGLSQFSTRFPSAFFGVLTIIALYYLSLGIFKEIPNFRSKAVYISLLASFFLAISPWHLQFSRAAFEVNVSTFITTLAVTCFIYGLRSPRLFLVSAFLFGLDLFSYHSARIVGPILLLSLFLLFNRKLPGKMYLLSFFAILSVFVFCFIPILLSPDAQIRFKATNIFNPGARYLNEKDLEKDFLDERLFDKKAGFELAGKIFHNQRLIYFDYDTLKKAFYNYISNFDFEYLFVKGDAPLHHAPGFGLLYIVSFPLVIIGLLYLLFKALNRYTAIIPIWMLISPIPNAVTREAPHSVRTELIVPAYQIFTALGLVVLILFVIKESKWVRFILILSLVFLFLINQSYYLHQYYVHTNIELSENWMYGRKEAVFFTENNKKNYDKVIVSMKVDMPYIFWLFYSKYPPKTYLSEGGTVSGGFADERNHFDKYEFKNFTYDKLPHDQKLLLVGTPDDIPANANILKTIYYLDGSIALKIAENSH